MGAPPADPQLARLDLLQAFKRRTARPDGLNVSPFANGISTVHGPAGDCDVDGIQAEVRGHIEGVIARVRAEGQSQVILVSGDAGTGKTHLLRQFERPDEAAEHGYVFVGGSNHWRVDEFTPYLLDRLVAALTAPSPSGSNLLWDRVRAIGFRAVDQLLENRPAFRRCQARVAGGWLGRRLARLRADPLDHARGLAVNRDPAVFGLLDPALFSEDVCDRFLAEPSNQVHRYALRVLLTILFPDPADREVGTAERVVHWLRRRTDDGHLARRLGVRDDLVAEYKAFDAVKLLVHLFTPEVTNELSAGAAPCESKVFLLTFDQAEGRDELFDSDADWVTFFAHLSELYNTLPNVAVLFTMTLGLRNRLHPKMERQFKDRIRQDKKFVLRNPTDDEILALYRTRIDRWVSDDPDLRARATALAGEYLPLGRDGVLGAAGKEAARLALENLDRAFIDALKAVVNTEPEYDFRFEMNQLRPQVALQGDWDFTADHLVTVRRLLDRAGDWLSAEAGVPMVKVEMEQQDDGPPIIRFDFQDPDVQAAWVRVYLARLEFRFKEVQVPKCLELLRYKATAKYSLWMVRAREFTADHDRSTDQVIERVADSDLEVRLRGLLHLLDNQDNYEAIGSWPAAQEVVRRVVNASYLGDLLRHAADRVAGIKSGKVNASPDDVSDEPAAAAGLFGGKP